jgi:chemotaxis protein MotB
LLNGRGGVWQNPSSFPVQSDLDPTVVGALARDLAALCEQEPGEQRVSIQSKLDGFSLSFDLRSSFAPGSLELSEALRENLTQLGKALQRYTHLIVVEGFTDTAFQPTPELPTAEALGLARAQAAARFLLEHSDLERDQVQISSVGMLRPRASNDTPSGRTSNRRIEVRVVALAKRSAAYGESGPTDKR